MRSRFPLVCCYLLLLTATTACKTNPVNNNNDTTSSTIQFSDEGLLYHYQNPNGGTEYVKLIRRAGNPEVGLYYYTTEQPNPVRLRVHRFEFHEGEISGYTGDVSFPNQPDAHIGLGIIEDRLTLLYSDELSKEFLCNNP